MAEKNDDDFFDQVQAMAERLGLVDDDKSRYVHEHMTRGGYRMVPSYVKDDDDGDKGDDFFGRGKSRGSRGGGKSEGKGGGWFPS